MNRSEKMARWSKHNNPSKNRRRAKISPYTAAYIDERRQELDRLLLEATTDHDREHLINAYSISIRP